MRRERSSSRMLGPSKSWYEMRRQKLCAYMCTGSRPSSCAATAMPASVCMCQTHCASGRAMWMALWMMKPARFAWYRFSPMEFPSSSILTSEEAVTSSKRSPYGLMRK
jgi:hypothetical protein